MVEAAFALPILFFFIFGLLDLGMWTFNSNQATNAAKDGTRAAIIVFEGSDGKGVDEAYSDAWNRAVGRIEARIDRDLDHTNVTFTCEEVGHGELPCKDVVLDDIERVFRIRTRVDWTWNLLTPMAGAIGVSEGAASGDATMQVIGKPVGSPRVVVPDDEPPPPEPPVIPDPLVDCVIDSVKVGKSAGSNGSIQIKTNGQLFDDIYVTYNTNGADRCNGLAVQLSTPGGTLRSAICQACTTTAHQWIFNDRNDKIWDPGIGQIRIFNQWVPGVTSNFTLIQ